MRPIFVFDGDCAFCSRCAGFIERRIHTPAQVVAWQRLDLPAHGLTADACADAVQWVGADGAVAAGPVAIARLLRHATGVGGRLLWRPAGSLLGTRWALALAWPAYRWVARNRHRMPGGTAACAVPTNLPWPGPAPGPGAGAARPESVPAAGSSTTPPAAG